VANTGTRAARTPIRSDGRALSHGFPFDWRRFLPRRGKNFFRQAAEIQEFSSEKFSHRCKRNEACLALARSTYAAKRLALPHSFDFLNEPDVASDEPNGG